MKDNIRPWILGIGCASHNGAVCLLRGDEVVVAVQEERLLRFKRAEHTGGLSSLAVPYCLEYAAIKPADLSAIGVCTFRGDTTRDDVYLNRQLQPVANDVVVWKLTHHLGHAVGAYATSGFERSAVLVVDGNGSPWNYLSRDELATVVESQRRRYGSDDDAVVEVLSMYSASSAGVHAIEKHVAKRYRGVAIGTGMRPFFSLGRLFENVGKQVFGEPLDGPGKIMGLAPYGHAVFGPEVFFEISGDEIVFRDDLQKRFSHDARWPAHKEEYIDLAASVQAALEHALLWYVARLRNKDSSDQLCYAGGVALNSVANERIVRESGYRDVFVMPAAEDSGTAVGAAYYALWQLQKRTTGRRLTSDCAGWRYTPDDIEAAVAKHSAVRWVRSSSIIDETAQMISEGQIVGWFQGGSELGPRALGQRSILADPRRSDMKDLLNRRIKFRESFRPYAPAILREHAAEWFETTTEQADSPFMLRVMKFRPQCRNRVPAVVHVDGTGRVQTVASEQNERFHALLSAFYRLTRVPLLLNTSFNTSGEPIVETPDDALWCLLVSNLDACILGDYVVTKRRGWSMLEWSPYLTAEWISHEYAVANGSSEDSRLRSLKNHVITSAPEGHLEEWSALARQRQSSHVRCTVKTRWGHVVHFVGPELMLVLPLMTGHRSTRNILELINSHGAFCSEPEFLKLLGKLCQRSVIAFEPQRLINELSVDALDADQPSSTG
jgi:carbamoyltransferase